MILIDKGKVLDTIRKRKYSAASIRLINEQPEVKAIPIEWIEKYIWSADTHEEKETLRKMYISWEKENETE